MATFEAKCPKCGSGFEAQEEWIGQEGECPACGATIPIEGPLKKAPQKKVVAKRPAFSYAPKAHVPKQERKQEPVPAPSDSKAKKPWKLIAAIAIALAAVICGAAFLLCGKTKNASSQSSGKNQSAAQEKPKVEDEKSWLSSNRAIVIDLASTASAFCKSSEFEKADAKYSMLFKIAGDRTFKDAMMNDILETSRKEYDQMKAVSALDAAKKANSLDDAIRCIEEALKAAKYDSNKSVLSEALEKYSNTKKETMNMVMGTVLLKKKDGTIIHPRPKIIIIKSDEILDKAYAEIAAELSEDNKGRAGGGYAEVARKIRDVNITKAHLAMAKRIQNLTIAFVNSKKSFAEFGLISSTATVNEDGSFSCKVRAPGKYYIWTEISTIGSQNVIWDIPIEKEEGKGLIINLDNSNVILTDA